MAYPNRFKMVNGHAKPEINDSASVENAFGKPKDIWKHISEISQVQGPQQFTKFVPLKGPSRADEERIRYQNNCPAPRNVRNLWLFEDSVDKEEKENRSDESDELFDENAVRASLRSVNGGREWSDRFLAQRWAKKSYKKAKIPIAMEQEKVENVSKKNRDVFARNVGMRSILEQKHEKKAEASTSRENRNINQDSENVGAINCRFPFIQDSLDPDFASRQFCGVDNKDDYIVEHVGKVVKVTARQFFIENITDEHFAFSRRNK